MDLSALLPLVQGMPAFHQLVGGLRVPGGRQRAKVLEAAKPYLLAALYQELGCSLLLVTPQPDEARRLYDQLLAWCPRSAGVLLFPELDALPYERLSSDLSTQRERLSVLSALTRGDRVLIVASAPALARKTIPYADFISACQEVREGMRGDPLHLLAQWESIGYEVENAVEVPGTVSRRGGIIDVYPPSEDYPQGYALNLTDSILRARYRNSRERGELMNPGEIYELTITLYPTSNLFKEGHRIRLDIASSNFPRFDVNPNTGEPIGSHRRTGKKLFNSLYYIKGGRIIYSYDKNLLFPFIEYIPFNIFNNTWAKNLFLKEPNAFVSNGVDHCDWVEIAPDLIFFPLICFDFYCGNRASLPEGITVLLLVNDSWFSYRYMKNLMFLYARFVACQSRQPILYISHTGGYWINRSGYVQPCSQ